MSNKSKFITLLAAFMITVAVIAYNRAISSDEKGGSSGDRIVAKVGNDVIYESQVRKEFDQTATRTGKKINYDSLAPEVKDSIIKSVVLGNLVEKKADQANIEKTKEYQNELPYELRDLKQKVYIDSLIKQNVTDQAIKNAYQDLVTKMKNEKEIKLDYILCETEDDAKKVAEMLKGITDFSKLVENAKKAGITVKLEQLDFFGKGEMLSGDVENKTFDLKKGETYGPVKTEFGWSIFKMVETRPKAVPSFQEMEPNIKNGLIEKFISDFVSNLESEYKVEFVTNENMNDKK